MRFQNLIHQPLLKYKFNQLIEGSIPNSSLQVDDRLNIDREFWSQVIYKAYTCERRLAQEVPQNPGYNSFFACWSFIFSCARCASCKHPASITQGCCEYIHITSILRALWLVHTTIGTNSSWLPKTSRNRLVNIDESHMTRYDLIFSVACASCLTIIYLH